MTQFNHIVVGIDLSEGDRFVGSELSPPNAEAVRRAIWLATLSSARLTFFTALNLSPTTRHLVEEGNAPTPDVVRAAEEAIDELVADAKSARVDAEGVVAIGKDWEELTKHAIASNADLVVVGTRHRGRLEGRLLGSTSAQLIHYCPAPVWVTQPIVGESFDHILVAHDLRGPGETALRLGCHLAERDNAELQVVHAIENRDATNEETARETIATQVAAQTTTLNPTITISQEPAAAAILKGLNEQESDLLVLGTQAPSSITARLLGTTAEKLLPQINCSVLVVKPAGFECPLTFDE